MRFLIINKHITGTFLFTLIMLIYGGDICAAIIEHAPLIQWLTTNNVNNTYLGVDFSLLPTVMVITVVFLLSSAIYYGITLINDAWEYFSTPPTPSEKNQPQNSGGNNYSIINEPEKTEPTLGNFNQKESDDDNKENNNEK
ncbi:hypothetical protein D3H66_19480 [Citrobacter portucalensis]|uniref:Uncharacterized protein n=1 Tax=Citrobacter portucalensis TaxID=1639133 RepID=A0A5B0SVW3_9ENTR|nr:hypothetical protein [Citrobacter portucalensis]KAA1141957.1 hypothetical protein D3H66_19480 [Citrobacter portucalensis]